ncbi:lipid A oxidase [Aliiruegeria haliotis]|uniref:Lipid A oxidase n=1 Tax=Aliiruegeria haliotis TaxID=1280846 RepID=A0A2T0RJF0_9RHOB|nr:outer membrane beta-barrel protein [Aliiruegeria haliotis]PRY21240.1 lipid A oxidase [Aliiruegeria haliotis]
MKRILPAALASVALSLPASAEVAISVYTGYQEAPHSRVKGDDGTNSFNFLAEWEGKSSAMPPYYGLRATWWRSQNIGYGLEFNHAKVYASDETQVDNGFDDLELTDGLNIFTANVFYRWPGQWAQGKLTPYAGGGVGFAMPHVDVQRGDSKTFEYQVTGPAVMLAGGVSYAFTEAWSVFGEYKGTMSWNDIELENGGNMKTDVITNALNIGVTYSF